MRKLNKIKLHDAVVLENKEMKMVLGGSGSSSCSGGGINNSTCSGTCNPRYVWNKEKMIMEQVSQTCKGFTLHAADGSGFITSCGCV